MKKLVIAVITIVILSLGFLGTGCTGKKKDKKPEVFLLLKTADNPFFRDIEKGTSENLMNKYELKVRAGKNESDVQYQLEVLQAIIAEAKADTSIVAGVIITPATSGSGLISQLQELHKLKIPIVVVDSKIDSTMLRDAGLDSLPYIGSSNKAGGMQAAEFITRTIPNGGKILILNGVQGQEPAQQRYEGFISIIDSLNNRNNEKYITTVRTGNWRRSEAIEIISGLYSYGNKYEAIFAANDEMALGAYQSLADLKIKPMPIIVGFDAIEEARKAITDKKITATIAQNPYRMGKEAVSLIDKIASKESVSTNNVIETEVIK